MTRDELKLHGLGSSEYPAIAGASPYASGSDVWLDRMGLGRGREDSPAMYAGRTLERPLLRMAAEAAGIPFRHNRASITHPDWPRVPLFTTPDGFGPGRRTLCEIKLVGHRFSDWQAGPPDYVRLQVAAQLACIPKAHRAVVAALVGSELRTYTIERDEQLERELVADVADWWHRYVVAEVAPEADSSAAGWRLLKATAAADDRAERLATPDEQRVGQELLAAQALVAETETRIDNLRRQLAEASKDHDVAGVGWSAQWRSRSDVSWKSAATAAGVTPEQVEAATRSSVAFVFRSTKASRE
jgi:predicted phage-related endonuclease